MYSLNPAHVAGCYDRAASGLLRQSLTQPLTCGNSWPICFHVPTPAKPLCPISLFCEDFILFTAAQDFRFLTKSSCIGSGQGQQKDASRRHTVHLILCFGFNAVAHKRQRSSAASEPCRRMCPISAPHRCLRSRSAACAGAAGTSGCPPPPSVSFRKQLRSRRLARPFPTHCPLKGQAVQSLLSAKYTWRSPATL